MLKSTLYYNQLIFKNILVKISSSQFLILVITMIFVGQSTSLQAQFSSLTSKTFGDGLRLTTKDSTFNLKMGFRIQNLVSADWRLADDEFGQEASFDATALIRRSRLKFDGWAYSPKIKYKIELALTNRDVNGGAINSNFGFAPNIILDAFVLYNFHNNLYVKFGQGKLPGNRERVISSANLQFVDRSRLNSRFNLDRDMMLQFGNEHTIGKQFLIKEKLTISQGEGRNQIVGFNGAFDYTFHVELFPFGKFKSKGEFVGAAIKRESTPKLAIGLSYDHNRNAARERGQLGNFIVNNSGAPVGRNLNSFFADLMFKYQNLSIMAEYANRIAEDDDPFVFDDEGINILGIYYTGNAYNIATGYMFGKNMEVALRYTNINADTATDEQHYTLGLSKYIVGHKLKVQTDFSFINLEQSQNQLLWRTQVELHF